MIHDPAEREDMIRAHIGRYRLGEIGPISFTKLMERDSGMSTNDIAELARVHKPESFERFAR